MLEWLAYAFGVARLILEVVHGLPQELVSDEIVRRNIRLLTSVADMLFGV